MNRPEFERELERLRGEIASLPADQRESLERLAVETAERHEAITRASLRGHRAAERLELSFEQLQAACDRVTRLSLAARDTLAQPRSAPPGMN